MLHGGQESLGEDIPVIALKSIFKKYDVDNDGTLSRDEFFVLLENEFNLSPEQINTYQWILDTDGDGEVSFDEFRHWVASNENFQTVDDKSRFTLMLLAIKLFEKYDENKDRTLDRHEFMRLHADCGGKPDNVSGALKYMDSDKNGTISFYEFLKWLNWVDLGNL